jgi:MYXO-CTERM domain-containing protein
MVPANDCICPKTGQRIPTHPARALTIVAAGLGAILWFLLRVVPKPSRVAYPCQRVAATTAAAFIVWVLGAGGLGALCRSAARRLERRSAATVLALGLVFSSAAGWLLFAQPAGTASAAYTTWTPTEGANAPMGQARGIFPGRVVWAYDPLATLWDGKNGHWWDPSSTDQSRVDTMLSKALQCLTGANTDAAAWNALFSSFNQRHGRSGGYSVGQKIVIKINQNTARGGHAQDGLASGDQNPINGNPHVILALLKQLVNNGGVAQDDIVVYDITRYIGDNIFVPCHAAFNGVHFVELDSGGGDGREAFDGQWVQNALTFAGQGVGRNLPKFVVDAAYMINLASLKAHGDDAGPTLHAKNHYGTVSGLNHTWPNATNSYSFFVELMGSKYLGENTLLFMIDGLYGAPGADASPARFASYPFSGNWPSSLMLSQDGVANESVGWDFINTEWGVPVGSDNTLREAATANAPGSGTKYAPNGDGVQLPSLGAHEHWNNPIDKKYSRNLGTGSGIELVQLFASDAPIALVRTGWTATASKQGDVPANAIDGKLNTRWTTGTARAADQWFEVNMGSAQTFSELVLDANGGTDYLGGYQVFVSNDGTNWGTPIAQGTATDAKTVITFSAQTASYFKVVATDAGSHWWSIYELNAYTTAGNVTVPVGGGTSTGGGPATTGGTSATAGGTAVAAGGTAATVGGATANAGGTAVTAGGATSTGDRPSTSVAGGTTSLATSSIGGSTSLAASGTGGSTGLIASSTGGTLGSVAINTSASTANGNAAQSDNSGGCGCRVAPASTDSSWIALFSLMGALAVTRRRRCSTKDSLTGVHNGGF